MAPVKGAKVGDIFFGQMEAPADFFGEEAWARDPGWEPFVHTLWPWDRGPAGVSAHYYQLSSDQQHLLGTTGIWAAGDADFPTPRYRSSSVPAFLFFQTMFPGRAVIIGEADGYPSWLDFPERAVRWLADMQQAWGERWHAQTRSDPVFAPAH